jgi:FkbM family methyltransferase
MSTPFRSSLARRARARFSYLRSTIRYVGVLGLLGTLFHRLRAAIARDVLNRRLIRRRVYDYEMLLDTRDRGISRTLIVFGRRELEHRILLQELVRPGMTIFDIGANIGYYALMESRFLNGAGHIVAIEPSVENARLLRANLCLNGVTDVTVLEAAVSDVEGERDLHLSPFSNLHSFHLLEAAPGARSIRVRTTSIPALAREFGAPDLIRMDVEGHEVEILNGLIPALQPGTLAPTIIFEVHRSRYSAEHDFSRTLRSLFANGYRVSRLGSSQDSGTTRLRQLGYRGGAPITTDFTTRVIFRDIEPEHAVSVICETGGARTVVLAPPLPAAASGTSRAAAMSRP